MRTNSLDVLTAYISPLEPGARTVQMIVGIQHVCKSMSTKSKGFAQEEGEEEEEEEKERIIIKEEEEVKVDYYIIII